MQCAFPVVVFSHLRWDWVYQRPQHLLARLAKSNPVIYIEEPIVDAGAKGLQIEQSRPCENVRVWRVRGPVPEHGYGEANNAMMTPVIRDFLKKEGVGESIVWFYTPAAVSMIKAVDPRAVVYDCMDELCAFKGARSDLPEQERHLLSIADLVFTGGRNLFEKKCTCHPNVHCFPSSVDVAHFSSALSGQPDPDDQATLPHPRVGYYGVIDERIDLPLLATLANERPEWQLVMVGPVTKIDPADLPKAGNICYTGQRPYESLPCYLGGWDVCMMPFAMNDATRYISPTKTLEYMAAEKPIVSTPIRDVERFYSHVVYLGQSHDEFVKACDSALNESASRRRDRVREMRSIVARTSWDSTVQAMGQLIDAVVTPAPRTRAADTDKVRKKPARRPEASTVIVGAGPTGLSAAYHAGPDSLLIERNERVGGWCRSVEVNGFTFDYAGHIMFSNDPYVHEMYGKLLGKNVHWQDREAWIYSKNVYTRYPFQGALYGLPPEVIKECIIGAVEARYGSLKPEDKKAGNGQSQAAGHGASATRCRTGNGKGKIEDCCGDGVLESTARLVQAVHHSGAAGGNGHGGPGPVEARPMNFEEFIYKVWGAGIAKHFAIPYNRKLWAVPLTEMETSWLGGRVPLPDLGEMIEGALRPVPKPMGPNARFGYPLRGGFQALMDGFMPFVQDRVRLNTAVTAVYPREKSIVLNGREEIPYENLISTMPLPTLIKMIGPQAPAEIHRAARSLRHVSVRCVHLGIGREKITDKHWIYYPEDSVFHRIFVQGNASPYCNPPGGFGLTCEITYGPGKPLPVDGDALIKRCIEDCIRVGIIKDSDEIWATAQCDLPYAYVIYDHTRARNVATIRDWLKEHDIHLAGRYSEWEYYNSDHAFIAGKKAAEAVTETAVAEPTLELAKAYASSSSFQQ